MKKNQELLETLPIAISKEEFASRVGLHVYRDDMSYIEAALHICEELKIDPEDIGQLVDNSLRSKLEQEAKRSNLLPRNNNTFELPV
jgi:hypothetical protein